MGTIQMPEVKWEWRIGPSTLVGFAQLIAIVVAIFGGFLKMQSDIEASHQTIAQLQAIVTSVKESQANQGERITRVETKIDVMLPLLQDLSGQRQKLLPR